MSDSELTLSEVAPQSEGTKLVAKADKPKRPATSEKDDATLLSEESSEEDDVNDLVLEYSDDFGGKADGKLVEDVQCAEGSSISASDDEITGYTGDEQAYDNVTSENKNNIKLNGEIPSQLSKIDTENVQHSPKDKSPMNNDEISKIADVLSTHLAIEQETKKQRQVATPGRAVPVRSNSNDSKLSRSKINEELGIKDNISSNENSETEENFEEETDLVGKVRASRENSTTSNADLEWDDDYTFNSRESPTEMSPRLMTFSDENEEAIINEEAYLNQEVNDAKEEEKPKVKNSARVNSKVHVDQKSVNSGINFYGTEETEEEAWSVGKRYTETNDIASEPSKEAEVGQRELILQPTEEKKDEKRRRQRKVKRKNTDVNKILSREDDTSHRKQKESFSQQTGSSKKTESPKGSPTAPTNTSNKAGSLSGQPQNSNKKQASSKTSRSSKKTRHKIYLDDPDVHQCIQDHATMLRKFIDDVESGKFVHSPKNRLHPVSRDDISPAKTRKKNRKYRSEQELDTLPGISFGGTKASEGQMRHAKSLGYMGPYDGHGKRGRNIISRIKEDSASSTSEDDDEHTNRTVNARSLKYNSRNSLGSAGRQHRDEIYEECPDCGERHPPDDDEYPSDQEVCPDCGVPHNPYQHPPSGQRKRYQTLDQCRNLFSGSRSGYRKVSQDPVEPSAEDALPSIEGPHTREELLNVVKYKMKYLGSTQIITQHPITKETRMQQAQEAYSRIKAPEGETQPSTAVEVQISLERIKVINTEQRLEDIMMDHSLRTICFICDMGDILVLMARRLTTESTDISFDDGRNLTLSNIIAEREKRSSKNICHVFQCEEAQKVAKAIGQAFNMAYRQFLKSNGISHDTVEEAEYCHVLESQRIVGQDLDKLTDTSNARDVVVQKKRGEYVGVMLLESGWGSMLPTVFVAHIANYSPAARLGGQLGVGDHLLACNGASLVGLPLSECQQIIRNTKSSSRVIFRVVSCPPVVDVVVTRPDTKYQLGFSVQNGTICSLLRGGIAERGGVRVGHRIIEINGESVVAKSHQRIVDILATTVGEISMKTMPVAMYRLMVGTDQPHHV